MRNLTLFLMICIALLSACKKDTLNVPATQEEKLLAYNDSVSFEINGKTYVFNSKYLRGTGNRQINLKPYTSEITGRRWATRTGGHYYYGPADSTLYESHYGFNSQATLGNITFLFTKQYRNDELRKDIHLLIPTDNSDLFKLGKQSFNVDYDKENTTDGVALEFNSREFPSVLVSYIPGFSIVLRSNLQKDLQDNSTFKIEKCESLDNGLYLIEAKFELNLFDRDGNLFPVENGFMRLLTNMKVAGI